MAEKITLIELHAHTDGSEFRMEPSLGSGVGELVSGALRGKRKLEDDDDDEGSVVDSLTTDDESEDDDSGGIVDSLTSDDDDEIDEIDEDDEDEDSGAGKGTGIAGILALIVFVFIARRFLGDDDDEDPFEQEFGQ